MGGGGGGGGGVGGWGGSSAFAIFYSIRRGIELCLGEGHPVCSPSPSVSNLIIW